MKVTATTRRALAWRREKRDYTKAGWETLEAPWDVTRGVRYDHRISEAEVSADGKSVWIKVVQKNG